MPPVGAFFAAVGAFSVTVLGVELAVGQWLLSTAFSMGVNMIFGSKPQAAQFERGISTRLNVAANVSRQVVYGRAKTAGSLAFGVETGTENEYLWLVIALADHECEGIHEIHVDDRVVSWDSGTGVVSEYTDGGTDHMEIFLQAGSESQTTEANLLAASAAWTSSHRGRGVCHVVVKLTWNPDLYGGIPGFEFVMDGRPLYDPRQDSTVSGGSGAHRYATPSTWEYTNDVGGNPALQLHDYLRGVETNGIRVAGMGIDADDVPLAEVMAAANVNEEAVALKAGGTELRYVSGVVLDTAAPHRTNIELLLAAMAGELHDHGGSLRMFSGEARTEILTIDDDDFVRAVQTGESTFQPAPVKFEPMRGRDEKVNRVVGRFVDSTNRWTDIEYPSRSDASYVTEDGGYDLEATLDLLAVQSGTQAQRIAEIFLRRSRYQGKLTATYIPALIELESGDWYSVASARYGWTGSAERTFFVESTTRNPDLTVSMVAQEIGSTVYDWTAATDEITPAGATAPTPPALGADYEAKLGALAPLDQVDTDEIVNLAVIAQKIDTDAVISTKIKNAAVQSAKLQNNAVTNAKVADEAIDDAEVAADRALVRETSSFPTSTATGVVQDTTNDQVYQDDGTNIYRSTPELQDDTMDANDSISDSNYIVVTGPQFDNVNDLAELRVVAASIAFQTPAADSDATVGNIAIFISDTSVAEGSAISGATNYRKIWEGSGAGLTFTTIGPNVAVDNNPLDTLFTWPDAIAPFVASETYEGTCYVLMCLKSDGTNDIHIASGATTRLDVVLKD